MSLELDPLSSETVRPTISEQESRVSKVLRRHSRVAVIPNSAEQVDTLIYLMTRLLLARADGTERGLFVGIGISTYCHLKLGSAMMANIWLGWGNIVQFEGGFEMLGG